MKNEKLAVKKEIRKGRIELIWNEGKKNLE